MTMDNETPTTPLACDIAVLADLIEKQHSAVVETGSKKFLLSHNTLDVHEIVDPNDPGISIWESRVMHDAASLASYVERFKTAGTFLVADYTTSKVQVTLDYHKDSQNLDLARHFATWCMRASEEWLRWCTFSSKMMNQKEFALFLEENSHDIIAPEAATFIEMAKDFEVAGNSSFKSRTRLDNGDNELSYKAESNAITKIVIPKAVKIRIPLYEGEKPVDLIGMFRWRVKDEAVAFGLDWHRAEYVRRAAFKDSVDALCKKVGLTAHYGDIT